MKNKKKLILFPCGCLVVILVICISAFLISEDFRVKLRVIGSEINDVIYETKSGDSTCNDYFSNGGLLNLSDQAMLDKEYDSPKDAINNYPWNTQYLPEADVYCIVPWNITSIKIIDGPTQDPTDSNTFSARLSLKEGDNSSYDPVVILRRNPETRKYKITSVQWFRV